MLIGIDPGATGAIAFLNNDKSLIEVVDMPTMPLSKKKNQVNAAELVRILSGVGGADVYLERVAAMPGQGVSSMFNFGASFGVIIGVCAALGLSVILVTPQTWKRKAGLIGKDKDYARTIGQQLYPDAPLGRKRDCGRADAILIARYGL